MSHVSVTPTRSIEISMGNKDNLGSFVDTAIYHTLLDAIKNDEPLGVLDKPVFVEKLNMPRDRLDLKKSTVFAFMYDKNLFK